ncbi:MAG: saccharopine dehydrogenase family protein [Gammaproteobacteria bacterium]
MPDIVLFGATGYTGRLTARAMVARGLRPVLAGRNRDALEALAGELGGLEVRVADVAKPVTVRKIVKSGDVLVSTVGPFARYGKPALDAALAGKAHYLDSTGEPAFIRQVFEQYGPRARAAGTAFITAFGYDYVPGHTVAAAALEKAGKNAVRVDVGYFFIGKVAMSQGTASSVASAMLEPGMLFNNGALQPGYGGLQTRKFNVDGKQVNALSLPASECIALPVSYPQLTDVNVYLGIGAVAPVFSAVSHAQSVLLRLPLYKRAVGWLANRVGSSGQGPSDEQRAQTGAHVIGIAYDAAGNALATAELRGVNVYTYTAGILAWGAEQALNDRLQTSGALGPVRAFGLEALIEGNREAGFDLTVR